MKTINLKTFAGNNFHDLYVFIMQEPAISYKLLIPRRQETTEFDPHLKNSMEFGCAAYAAHKISEVCSDFSYLVPSPWQKKPFEFYIETTEPEKFADVIFILLCAYHPKFTKWQTDDFHYKAAEYFREAVSTGMKGKFAGGLLMVAEEEMWLVGV